MGKIVERPILKRLKDKICFFFFKKRQLLPLEMDYAAGWFCSISACSWFPEVFAFAKRRTSMSDFMTKLIQYLSSHCPLKRQWPQDPEWLNNLNEHLLSGLLWVICFCEAIPRGVALHLQSVSLYVWPWQGVTKRGGYIIISVKGLLVFFCSHMKRVKMSPIIQPV